MNYYRGEVDLIGGEKLSVHVWATSFDRARRMMQKRAGFDWKSSTLAGHGPAECVKRAHIRFEMQSSTPCFGAQK